MRLIPGSLRRPASRALILVALIALIASGAFAFLPLTLGPRGPVVAAAPTGSLSSSAVTSATSSPGASASQPASAATQSPTATPRPASTTSPAVPGLAPVPASTADPTRPLTVVQAGLPPTADPTTRQALTARLGSLRSTYGLPGVSSAILFADGTMWRATSGFADVSTRRRLTADTEFAVASISKTFLSALILVLAEEGKLDIEAPVVTYLPELAIDPTITIRQLLDHTSGLHDFFYDPDIDEALLADRRRVWTSDDVLAYVGKPYFKPGTGWHYSNTNYVILGRLAETIEGVPLPEQLRTRFLAPLGLDHTHYQGIEAPLGPIARAYRFDAAGVREKPIPVGDGTNVVPFTSVVTAAGSAGSLASTADDLATWARALYGGNVLTPGSFVTMVTDAQRTAAFKPSIPYGLGVQEATIDGRPTLGHSGRLLGSRSVVRWLPNEGIAIAVVTNQSRSDPGLVARALLRVVLGTPLPCSTCTPMPAG